MTPFASPRGGRCGLPSPRVRLATTIVLIGWLSGSVAGAQVQTATTELQQRDEFSVLPETGGAFWTRLGTGPALILDGERLLLNDNSPAEKVAYQGLAGQLEARHRITFRAQVQVISNLGGEAAVVEMSRPGLEIVVRLRPDRIDVLEREDRFGERWLGSAAVDLSVPRELALSKASVDENAHESVTVQIDGLQVLRARPRGRGSLEVGRLAFGSLSYFDMGASVWDWAEVRVETIQPDGNSIPVQTLSFGDVKARFR